MKEEKKLEGKTIKKAWIESQNDEFGEPYDDTPYLFLQMEDGSVFKIIASYGGYTGKSYDEYPAFIYVKMKKK